MRSAVVKRITPAALRLITIAVLVIAIVGVMNFGNAMAQVVTYQWGPNRTTYNYNSSDDYGSLTGPAFDSYTNLSTYGDERSFLTAIPSNSSYANYYWNTNIKVTPGETILLQIYVDNVANVATNSASYGYIGIAKNTRVRFFIPKGQAEGFNVDGYISADNAIPHRVYSTTYIYSESSEAISLQYIRGSARIYNYYELGAFKNGAAMPDTVVSRTGAGALIGYNKLDGILPGGFDSSELIRIKVKILQGTVVLAPNTVTANILPQWLQLALVLLGLFLVFQAALSARRFQDKETSRK
jgi:hypothetical protein